MVFHLYTIFGERVAGRYSPRLFFSHERIHISKRPKPAKWTKSGRDDLRTVRRPISGTSTRPRNPKSLSHRRGPRSHVSHTCTAHRHARTIQEQRAAELPPHSRGGGKVPFGAQKREIPRVQNHASTHGAKIPRRHRPKEHHWQRFHRRFRESRQRPKPRNNQQDHRKQFHVTHKAQHTSP